MSKTDDKSIETSVTERATGVIPVLYFDIIARIIPGCAFLLTLEWYRLNSLKIEALGDTGNFIVLLGAGYIVGQLLTFGSLVLDGIWQILANVSSHSSHSPTEIAYTLDRISRVDRYSGDVLFKMYAESVATENILTGYVMLLVASYNLDAEQKQFTALSGVPKSVQYTILALLILGTIYRACVVGRRTNMVKEDIEAATGKQLQSLQRLVPK